MKRKFYIYKNGNYYEDSNAKSTTADEIDSESASNGQVLTANGSGGASWQTPSGGGGLKLYRHSISVYGGDSYLEIISTDNTPITSGAGILTYLHNGLFDGDYEILKIFESYSDSGYAQDIIYSGYNNVGKLYAINNTAIVDVTTRLTSSFGSDSVIEIGN